LPNTEPPSQYLGGCGGKTPAPTLRTALQIDQSIKFQCPRSRALFPQLLGGLPSEGQPVYFIIRASGLTSGGPAADGMRNDICFLVQ
jgi:hypothetical protein